MSVLRTMKCRVCGESHLVGQQCRCGGRKRSSVRTSQRALLLGLVFLVTVFTIVGVSMALVESKGSPLYGVFFALGCWLVMQLWRLGYDSDDGVDMFKLLLVLPFPLDFSAQWESFMNFWTSPRPYFRVIYIGTYIAMMLVLVLSGFLAARTGLG